MQLLDETETHRNYSLPRWAFGLLALLIISLTLLLLPAIDPRLDVTRFGPSHPQAILVPIEKDELCSPDDILRSIVLDRVVDTFDYTISHEQVAESLQLDPMMDSNCERLRIFDSSEAIHLISVLVRFFSRSL